MDVVRPTDVLIRGIPIYSVYDREGIALKENELASSRNEPAWQSGLPCGSDSSIRIAYYPSNVLNAIWHLAVPQTIQLPPHSD